MYLYNYVVNSSKTPSIDEAYLNGDELELHEVDGRVSRVALEALRIPELLEGYGAKESDRLFVQSLSERKYTYGYGAPLLATGLWIAAIPTLPFLMLMSLFAHDSPRNDGLVTPPERALAWYTDLLFSSLAALSPEEGYEASNQELLKDMRMGLSNLSKISGALCRSKEYQGILLDPSYIAHQSALTEHLISN